MICKICGNGRAKAVHRVREMRLGYREFFEYVECAECGALQIANLPEDLLKYYPPTYAPFQRRRVCRNDPISRWLKRARTRYTLGHGGLIGRVIARLKPAPDYYGVFRKFGIGFNSRILDLGCGGGDLLLALRADGFTNLTGVDLFAPSTVAQSADGVVFIRGTVDELNKVPPFDFIMMHHSLEHMSEPLAVLQKVHRLLQAEGVVWIRIPVVGYGWRRYGVNWVQLDAPRHFVIPTAGGMRILAARSGFKIVDVRYDSTEHLFLGSEQYERDIAIWDRNSYWVNPKTSIFTEDQVRQFRRLAHDLNQKGDGDQASFCLKKMDKAHSAEP